ncbi:hypothetical protein VTN96DRAFT_8399 [Rasamsonia emersonii]
MKPLYTFLLTIIPPLATSLTIAVTQDGACAGPFVNNGPICGDLSCFTFSEPGNFGALFETGPGELCTVEFFTGAGCTGDINTFLINPDTDSTCVPIADQDGVLVFPSGMASVTANCGLPAGSC